MASGQGRSNVFPSIGPGAAAQREILKAWTQAVIFGRAPLDGEGALPVKLEHASAQEGGARYNVVFNGLAWRSGGQVALESAPREFQVLVYSLLIL